MRGMEGCEDRTKLTFELLIAKLMGGLLGMAEELWKSKREKFSLTDIDSPC